MVYGRVKRFVAASVACVIAAVALGGCGDGDRATSLPGLTKSKQANVKAILRTEFRILGDAHPRVSSVTVFATELQTAARASGNDALMNETRPVYLVLVRGHFSCHGCGPRRPGSTAGLDLRIMALVLDRKTLRYESGGSIGRRVRTQNLGQGMPLAFHTAAIHA